MVLSKKLIEFNRMIRGFLWGETSGVRKIHSIAWERVCLPKEQGGLNVRDTRKVNLALLAKLGWQILSNKNSLWIEAVKKKYLKNEN